MCAQWAICSRMFFIAIYYTLLLTVTNYSFFAKYTSTLGHVWSIILFDHVYNIFAGERLMINLRAIWIRLCLQPMTPVEFRHIESQFPLWVKWSTTGCEIYPVEASTFDDDLFNVHVTLLQCNLAKLHINPHTYFCWDDCPLFHPQFSIVIQILMELLFGNHPSFSELMATKFRGTTTVLLWHMPHFVRRL